MGDKILIVDDDSEDLKLIGETLTKEGFETVNATNGAEAIDKLEDHDFDLIILDVQMPTLSGSDLLKLLREKLSKKVPMIYVTVVPKEEIDVSDVEGYLKKPFSPESLMAKVKGAIK